MCLKAFGSSSSEQLVSPMGSQPRFSPRPDPCDRCGRFVLMCAWSRCPDVCLECVAHCRSLQLVPLLRKTLHIEPSLNIVTLVDQFSFDYSAYTRKSRQLHFLDNVLRSRGSPFLQFTYFHHGLLGNISQTEDILDRITSFL